MPSRDSTPDDAGETEDELLGAELSEEERRVSERFDVTWCVDCETEDTFLYAKIRNISEMGIFVYTTEPLPVGTPLKLRFSPAHRPIAEFVLDGQVQWINPVKPTCPNPGMGVRFTALTLEDRERLVEVIRTIAYLPEYIGLN